MEETRANHPDGGNKRVIRVKRQDRVTSRAKCSNEDATELLSRSMALWRQILAGVLDQMLAGLSKLTSVGLVRNFEEYFRVQYLCLLYYYIKGMRGVAGWRHHLCLFSTIAG